MKHGTYSEALAAGFNEKQAGMLARLGGDTRDEVIADIRTYVVKKRALKPEQHKEDDSSVDRYVVGIFLIIGCAIGAAAMALIKLHC